MAKAACPARYIRDKKGKRHGTRHHAGRRHNKLEGRRRNGNVRCKSAGCVRRNANQRVRYCPADDFRHEGIHGQTRYTDLSQIRGIIVPQVKTATEVTLFGGYAKIIEPNLSAPCKDSCPHHVPAQAYIQKVAKGEYRDAFDLITSKDPLQRVCGLVCSHPCEEACTRGITGRPVQIRDIKRFVLEYGKSKAGNRQRQSARKRLPCGRYRLRPARSYLCGSFMPGRLCGNGIRREPKLGGIARYSLPKFRLEDSVIEEEIRNTEKAWGNI